jgi:basic membrane protein A and related proteins
MRTRKLMSLFSIIVIISLLLAACGQQGPTKVGNYEIPTVERGKFNVAFVYVGSVGDGGWTYAHNQGRLFLEKNGTNVHTAYIENVAEGTDSEQVIRALARKGFNLIITTSFGFMDPTETVAKEFPKVKFVHISGFKKNDTNFGNVFGAMESMKYLAGMVAGARAKEDNNPRIGYIAPFPIPEVIRLGNAIMLGAKQTCPECTLEIRWMNSWFDPNMEQQSAESMFNAGVDVVITGADTTGPIVVAGQMNKWAVGYDSDNACNADLAHCLTVPHWNWGPVYLDMVKQMQAGTWKPSSWYGDVDSGVVGLYGFNEGQTPAPGVPASVVPLVQKKLADMKAGKFTRFDVFAGPIKDNKGNVVIPAGTKLTQLDLEGLEGCTICMSWLAEGIIGELPQ